MANLSLNVNPYILGVVENIPLRNYNNAGMTALSKWSDSGINI